MTEVGRSLRLLSYNIRALRDDRDAVARVIRAAAPDVVCIQEAPRFLRWRSICASLARHSGLVVVGGGRPAGSNLILSSLAVTVDAVHDVKFTKDPRLHQRGTAIAQMRLAGKAFAVAGTHLDLSDEPRLRHVGELHDALDRLVPATVPTIVIGDINATPGSPAWSALTAVRTDAAAAAGLDPDDEQPGYTYSATKPVRRIDGIFVDSRITVESCEVLASDDTRIATDHSPLLAVLTLP